MSKTKTQPNLGDIYGNMLNSVKRRVVSEGKTGALAGKEEIGTPTLVKGGPETTAGYMMTKIDKKKLSDKELKDNYYNVDELSDDIESKCEDEETLIDKKTSKTNKEIKKIAHESLNNFMRKKSIFDKLYENVMFGDDSQELDALGIESDAEGMDDLEGEDDLGDEDEITITLDKATARKLLDVLSAVVGSEEDLGDDELGGDSEEDLGLEEDEENLAGATNFTKPVDFGKNNKVGSLKTSSGGANSSVTDKIGNDGDHGHAIAGAKQPNMGKSNKVGGLKTGKSLFEQ